MVEGEVAWMRFLLDSPSNLKIRQSFHLLRFEARRLVAGKTVPSSYLRVPCGFNQAILYELGEQYGKKWSAWEVGGNKMVPQSITDAEQEARAKTEQDLPRECELALRILNLSLEGLSRLGKPKFSDSWLQVILELAMSSVNSYRVAHLALLSGYPADAIRTLRTVFENYLFAHDIVAKHEDADLLSDPKYVRYLGKLPGLPGPLEGTAVPDPGDEEDLFIPDAPKLIKRITHGDDAKCRELLLLYHWLSQVGHPRVLGLGLGRRESDEGVYLYLGGEFRRDDALYAFNALLGLGTFVVEMVAGFLLNDAEWQAKFLALNRDWVNWEQAYRADLAKRIDQSTSS